MIYLNHQKRGSFSSSRFTINLGIIEVANRRESYQRLSWGNFSDTVFVEFMQLRVPTVDPMGCPPIVFLCANFGHFHTQPHRSVIRSDRNLDISHRDKVTQQLCDKQVIKS